MAYLSRDAVADIVSGNSDGTKGIGIGYVNRRIHFRRSPRTYGCSVFRFSSEADVI
jgi:hypothetical protein